MSSQRSVCVACCAFADVASTYTIATALLKSLSGRGYECGHGSGREGEREAGGLQGDAWARTRKLSTLQSPTRMLASFIPPMALRPRISTRARSPHSANPHPLPLPPTQGHLWPCSNQLPHPPHSQASRRLRVSRSGNNVCAYSAGNGADRWCSSCSGRYHITAHC